MVALFGRLTFGATGLASKTVLGLLVYEHTIWASADLEGVKINSDFTGLVAGFDTFLFSIEPSFSTSTSTVGFTWLTDTSELNKFVDIRIEWLTIGKIWKSSIFSIEFFTSQWVFLLLFLSTTSWNNETESSENSSTDSSLSGFDISSRNFTFLKIFFGFKVGISLLLVLVDSIVSGVVTIITLKSVFISFWK